MRRTLAGLFTAAAVVALAPTGAQATHACAEGFEVLCTRICPKPSLCIHP